MNAIISRGEKTARAFCAKVQVLLLIAVDFYFKWREQAHAPTVKNSQPLALPTNLWYNGVTKGGDFMQEIKDKVLEIIDRYEEQLSAKGIKIAISKKYVETDVQERSGGYANSGQAIFNILERANDRKKEKEKGYNFTRNKYHSLVLTIVPLDKTLVQHENCREFAFVLKKVERAHLGQKPQKKSYQEAKILAKIEKRILQILKKANPKNPQQICKNTFGDAFRYTHSLKYEYKTKFCGKERFTWDMIFMFLAVAIVVVALVAVWAITKFV